LVSTPQISLHGINSRFKSLQDLAQDEPTDRSPFAVPHQDVGGAAVAVAVDTVQDHPVEGGTHLAAVVVDNHGIGFGGDPLAEEVAAVVGLAVIVVVAAAVEDIQGLVGVAFHTADPVVAVGPWEDPAALVVADSEDPHTDLPGLEVDTQVVAHILMDDPHCHQDNLVDDRLDTLLVAEVAPLEQVGLRIVLIRNRVAFHLEEDYSQIYLQVLSLPVPKWLPHKGNIIFFQNEPQINFSKGATKINQESSLTSKFQGYLQELLALIDCPAIVAPVTTLSLALSTASLVRFPNPRRVCHDFPSASLTAVVPSPNPWVTSELAVVRPEAGVGASPY
jgi:hypothetical protein